MKIFRNLIKIYTLRKLDHSNYTQIIQNTIWRNWREAVIFSWKQYKIYYIKKHPLSHCWDFCNDNFFSKLPQSPLTNCADRTLKDKARRCLPEKIVIKQSTPNFPKLSTLFPFDYCSPPCYKFHVLPSLLLLLKSKMAAVAYTKKLLTTGLPLCWYACYPKI